MQTLHLFVAFFGSGIVLGWLITEWAEDKVLDAARAKIVRLTEAMDRLHEDNLRLTQENTDAQTLVETELGATEILS